MPKKVDANQTAMVGVLRQCGLHVLHLHALGRGAPDLLVTGYVYDFRAWAAVLVEIKDGKGKLTPAEVAWHAAYPKDGPLIVARSADDVLAWFGMVEGG